MRWRHLACAAQTLPEALLGALELDGWRAVPDEDHEELRRLIDEARARRRSGPVRAATDRERAEPSAARSSSAMAAAAVLEPAHAAARLRPDQDRAWVFADQLQSRGDLRGELLALELAAEFSDDPLQARALQRELWTCRRRWRELARPLPASTQLRLRWVGGFLLGAHPKGRAEISRLLAADAATSLDRLRLDFCTQDELARLVSGAKLHGRRVAVLDLQHSRVSSLAPLAELAGLRRLRVADRFEPTVLAELESLRALSLASRSPLARAAELAHRPELERVELINPSPESLTGLARHLPNLRWLSVTGLSLDEGPRFCAGLRSLKVLRLPDSPVRSLAGLEQLAALRELAIVPGNLGLVRALPALSGLERLALVGSNVGELDALAALSKLRHLALQATRVTDFSGLRELAKLRSLSIEGGDMRRLEGIDRLRGLEQLGLHKLANLDLAELLELPRLHTLVLRPGGRWPRSLARLRELAALRRLSAPFELFAALDEPAEVLADVEILELVGEGLPALESIRALPRLRRLLLPGRDPAAAAALAEALPEVGVFTELAPRDLLDHRDYFDWRASPWPSRV